MITRKYTIAAYRPADMRRVFQFIGADDLLPLDRLMLSGRAYHLPKGGEVYLLDSSKEKEGMCNLRIKEAITEIWASARAVIERQGIAKLGI